MAERDTDDASTYATRTASQGEDTAASSPPAPSPRAIAPSARYEVQGQLGAGGRGVVLAALDRESQRVVALKVPKPHAPPGADAASLEREIAPERRRFVEEACLTAQLEHPAIVPVYDVGQTDSGPYTMRVVGRRSLHDVLTSEPRWTTARLVSVLVQVARALAYAHARGVVHRDLKPANVLVGDFGEVYLADWGIARVADDSPVSPRLARAPRGRPAVHATPLDTGTLLTPSDLVGTPGYIAPEVLSGDWLIPRRTARATWQAACASGSPTIAPYSTLRRRKLRKNPRQGHHETPPRDGE